MIAKVLFFALCCIGSFFAGLAWMDLRWMQRFQAQLMLARHDMEERVARAIRSDFRLAFERWMFETIGNAPSWAKDKKPFRLEDHGPGKCGGPGACGDCS